MGPTSQYFEALEDSRRHHAASKTFSGSLLRPHAPFIKEIIDRLGCASILDYGCGKGVQYEWQNNDPIGSIPVGMTIGKFWGIPITMYDPAFPPFAKEPTGKFDIVICTHTLGAIPIGDLPWVIGRLHSLANKAVYVAEKLGPVKKKVFRSPAEMPSGWSADRWREILRANHRSGVELHFAARTIAADGAKTVAREIIGR
ncbi:hypothetical protein MesoLjLc_50730 [Mesorhizobium sp. L-8-10]|uniref:methyltransferase domain-containing protein n=1 Tax=Mesorhizobium sp. L-8-10 TaxID=2744523 RepID=UPI0019290193|nr:methyltransferase domain-containing protein [Mesorhizobium sp. L-8-10]BCH33143.1 hypothetical protein MesoLjLc_50730 [Mesorhizobium sp. L-8-10]